MWIGNRGSDGMFYSTSTIPPWQTTGITDPKPLRQRVCTSSFLASLNQKAFLLQGTRIDHVRQARLLPVVGDYYNWHGWKRPTMLPEWFLAHDRHCTLDYGLRETTCETWLRDHGVSPQRESLYF